MEFGKLTDHFGHESLLGEWKDPIRNIIEAPDFCRMRKTSARYFWGHYLSQTTFEISVRLRLVLCQALVIVLMAREPSVS